MYAPSCIVRYKLYDVYCMIMLYYACSMLYLLWCSLCGVLQMVCWMFYTYKVILYAACFRLYALWCWVHVVYSKLYGYVLSNVCCRLYAVCLNVRYQMFKWSPTRAGWRPFKHLITCHYQVFSTGIFYIPNLMTTLLRLGYFSSNWCWPGWSAQHHSTLSWVGYRYYQYFCDVITWKWRMEWHQL